jgi:Tfp pilus assembly protein PilX
VSAPFTPEQESRLRELVRQEIAAALAQRAAESAVRWAEWDKELGRYTTGMLARHARTRTL